MRATGNEATGSSVIVGLGSTGLSCARFMSANKMSFSVMDSRNSPPFLDQLYDISPDIKTVLGGFSVRELINAKEIILSPGVSLKQHEIAQAVAAGVPVTGDIDIFSKTVSAPIIAVTGSNGKSTVVAQVAAILDAANIRYGLGGNLDGDQFMPALDLLAQEEKDVYVLELSSFQLETTQRLNAQVAVVLNISEDHMDRYENLEDYQAAKERIFRGCSSVVVNRDGAAVDYSAAKEATQITYGLSLPEADGYGLYRESQDLFLAQKKEGVVSKILNVRELQLPGIHNYSNALAAAALCGVIGVTHEQIAAGLRQFSGLSHRCQHVRKLNGVEYFNDSKATNVGASIAAIESLVSDMDEHAKLILIAGGSSKEADYSHLARAIDENVDELILIGDSAAEIAAQLSAPMSPRFAKQLEEAVLLAQSLSAEGDRVILSPACASFDMFSDFRHRGEVFTELVEALP